VEVPNWAVTVLCGLGVIALVLRKMPIVLREFQKVAAAYYDLKDEIARRRRARVRRK
jgi:hypothetical protein